jgi:hypothetical protein
LEGFAGGCRKDDWAGAEFAAALAFSATDFLGFFASRFDLICPFAMALPQVDRLGKVY